MEMDRIFLVSAFVSTSWFQASQIHLQLFGRMISVDLLRCAVEDNGISPGNGWIS